MAETANIARIAEKVSSQLFAEFGWHPCAPRNTSWDCGLRERHRTKASSHPSDIVFCYDDPYDAGFVYVTAVELTQFGGHPAQGNGRRKVTTCQRKMGNERDAYTRASSRQIR